MGRGLNTSHGGFQVIVFIDICDQFLILIMKVLDQNENCTIILYRHLDILITHKKLLI